MSNESNDSASVVRSAFGAANRNRLIDQYFQSLPKPPTADQAWKHVYKLLLWPDQTTGLAHCYESDKSQPGKNWYSRSLAFHDWLSTEFETSPLLLASEIDWLFLRATEDLAVEVTRRADRLAKAADRQRKPYASREFPSPGEDPELISIVRHELGDALAIEPTPEQWRSFVRRIRQYLALENKRKNLVGEGFEDVLHQVVSRTCDPTHTQIYTRTLLEKLPGFGNAGHGEKPNRVDLAIVRPQMRTLVTAKWSVRADREKQFTSEFGDYIKAESERRPWEYVFITNEFDPARLRRACEQLASNAYMFKHVVHINTDALKATYHRISDSDSSRPRVRSSEGAPLEETMARILRYIEEGRLISLGKWLEILKANL